MTLHVFEHLEQGSQEWLDQRRGMLTASVIGQLIAVEHASALDFCCPSCQALDNEPCKSKTNGAAIKTVHTERTTYASQHKGEVPDRIVVADTDASRRLTSELVAERITGWSDPTFTNSDMQRGHDVEPIARDLYAETRKVSVTQVGFMVLEEDGFRLGYSPDGLVADDGLIEVKAPRAKTHLWTHLSGRIPVSHMPQIQAGLRVTGRGWCDFISFYGGMPPFIQRVYPDQKWFDAIDAAARKFEADAAEMETKYRNATNGLPMTERLLVDMEIF